MTDQVNSLEELGQVAEGVAATATAAVSEAPKYVAVRDELGRSYATGKRKDAVARVWIKPGSGKVVVNGREMNKYFARPVLQMILRQPFTVAGVEDQFDVNATVKGGGLSGQAGAVKHGISKALQLYDPNLRAALKAAGFLTRDSRVVERKKFGKAKAVRASSSPSVKLWDYGIGKGCLWVALFRLWVFGCWQRSLVRLDQQGRADRRRCRIQANPRAGRGFACRGNCARKVRRPHVTSPDMSRKHRCGRALVRRDVA